VAVRPVRSAGSASAAALPETMQVIACGADGSTRLETRPVPSVAAGKMLLELVCCGLCGTDLFKLSTASVADGTVLGHEIVGRVRAVGDDVVGFELGERVVVPHHVACASCALCRRGATTQCDDFRENLLVPGGFAEYVLVRPRAVQQAVWRVPDHVPDAVAVFLEPAACVLRGIDSARMPNGEGCAVVLGGGSMGLLHLVVLRAVDPRFRVVVCDPMAERRRLAVELGASAAVPVDDVSLADAVRALSGGLGADAVFDTVGGAGPLAQGLAVLRSGGVVVLFAHAAAGEGADFELTACFKTEQRVVATYSGALDEQRRIAQMLADRRLDPSALVTHHLPLASFDEAVALANERRALKVLLHPEAV